MKKKHIAVLTEIGATIPKEFTDNLMMKVDNWTTLREVMKKAVEDPEISEDQKEKYRLILKAGYLDTQEEVSNPEIEKKIDEYLTGEIERAKRLGKLPKNFKPNAKSKRKSTKRDEGEQSSEHN